MTETESRALAARTGGAANWCTFAVWASKQVGQTIRQEDLARTVERLLRSSPEAAAGIDLVVRSLRLAVPKESLDSAPDGAAGRGGDCTA